MSSMKRIAAVVELYAILLACAATIGFVGYRALHPASSTHSSGPVPSYGAIPVVFFYMPDCPACKAAEPAVDALAQQYPKQVVQVNCTTGPGSALVQQYYAAYKVPKEKQNKIPIAFAGGRYFFGTIEVGEQLPAYVKQASAKGGLHAPPVSSTAIAAAS